MGETRDVIHGQIWRAVDPRIDRLVRILGVDERHGRREVTIETVGRLPDGSGYYKLPRTRTNYADKGRFNGKHGGYSYVDG